MGTYLSGSSLSSPSYCSLNVRAKKKMIPAATARKPTTDTMAIPTTRGSETYSSQCSPRYHQFSPTRHLQPRSHTNIHGSVRGQQMFREQWWSGRCHCSWPADGALAGNDVTFAIIEAEVFLQLADTHARQSIHAQVASIAHTLGFAWPAVHHTLGELVACLELTRISLVTWGKAAKMSRAFVVEFLKWCWYKTVTTGTRIKTSEKKIQVTTSVKIGYNFVVDVYEQMCSTFNFMLFWAPPYTMENIHCIL